MSAHLLEFIDKFATKIARMASRVFDLIDTDIDELLGDIFGDVPIISDFLDLVSELLLGVVGNVTILDIMTTSIGFFLGFSLLKWFADVIT